MTKHNAVSVHLVGADEGVLSGAGQPADKRRVLSRYQTYVLTANDPAMEILPVDPDRVEYTIIAIDNDIILGPTKGVAGAAVNTVAGVPNPNGAYIPKQLNITLQDTGQVACGITTTAANSRVTIIDTYYEAPEG